MTIVKIVQCLKICLKRLEIYPEWKQLFKILLKRFKTFLKYIFVQKNKNVPALTKTVTTAWFKIIQDLKNNLNETGLKEQNDVYSGLKFIHNDKNVFRITWNLSKMCRNLFRLTQICPKWLKCFYKMTNIWTE